MCQIVFCGTIVSRQISGFDFFEKWVSATHLMHSATHFMHSTTHACTHHHFLSNTFTKLHSLFSSWNSEIGSYCHPTDHHAVDDRSLFTCINVGAIFALYSVAHYGHQTTKFSRLSQYVMWSFEQFNQHFKSQWVRNKNHPMTSAGIFLSFCHARHPTSLFASNFTHSHVNVTRSFTVDGAASYLIGKKTTIQTRVILEPWDHAGQYQSRSRFSSVTSRHQSTPLHAYITLAVCPVFIPSQREMYGWFNFWTSNLRYEHLRSVTRWICTAQARLHFRSVIYARRTPNRRVDITCNNWSR